MSVNRLDLYLQWGQKDKYYANTKTEEELLNKFVALYSLAESAQKNSAECNPDMLDKCRKSYLGTLGALTRDGKISKQPSRALRKVAYEIVESVVDNSVPMPKITPRYKTDLPLVDITENYLKFEMDRILTKYVNDENERSTYVDGTSWYKVWWDSLDNTHERSGNVKIECLKADQVIPQPGVKDYKQLEYIFEKQRVSISRLYDMYGRLIMPNDGNTNVVDVISCYYLNEDRVVGLFSWAEHSRQVICNEHDWQIRKVRTCTTCGTINPTGSTCRLCGSTTMRYKNATKETLEEDLVQLYNPYEVGETDDPQQNQTQQKVFATAGTEIPFYELDQLPFVPRPAVSSIDSIYGLSIVGLIIEQQDMINKLYTKAADKTLKSGAVVTKPEKLKIGDKDDSFKVLGVRSQDEAAQIQVKQIVADTTQDITLASMMYDNIKSSTGVTDSFQGKKDTTAVSGKAKAYSVAQSAGRIESMRVMKAAAFSGVYELTLKYLLAFSDEPREFVKILPDGTQKQMTWNKYMFLDKDKYGNIYYRDDFHFDSDPAATLSQSRQSMWQETQDKFIQGALGNVADPRTLQLFWNIMDSFQYPLAKVVLAGIQDNTQHLPFEIEQAIMQNPEVMQMLQSMLQEGQDGRGGARPNSGPKASGKTHAAQVNATNEQNRAAARTPEGASAQQGGIL